MAAKKQDMYFWGSLVFAIWFALTGYFWTYFMNLFVSYPFGILSLVLWMAGRKKNPGVKRYNIIIWILGTGLAASLGALLCFR